MSNSLDPDQDRRSDGLHLGLNCLQKAIDRRQNSLLTCKELNQVNNLVFNILSNKGSITQQPTLLGPALVLCKNTYSDRAKRPPAFLKSLYLNMKSSFLFYGGIKQFNQAH